MPSLPVRAAAALVVLTALTACQGDEEPASSPAVAPAGDPRAETIREWYLDELATLESTVDSLEIQVATGAPAAEVHGTFEAARDRYKRIEFLVEHYSATAAGEINGPPIPEVYEDDPNRFIHPPEGFQVIEEAIYPEPDHGEAETAEIVNEIRILRNNIRRVEQLTAASAFGDPQVWEAARREVVRIATLGVSGFDSPVALRSIPEAASAFEGIADALAAYEGPAVAGLLEELERSAAALRARPDFDDFDRVSFFRERVPALLGTLRDARLALEVEPTREPQAIPMHVTNLFAADALDPEYFAPLGAPPATEAEVELGRRLFRDPALSGTGDRSCATCHIPELAFTDGRARSASLTEGGTPLRNAPTIVNAGLQVGSFYDLRTDFLEDQVTDVVGNPQEMHGDLSKAAERIAADPEYGPLLRELKRQSNGGELVTRPASRVEGEVASIDADVIRRSLAAYVRSLSSLNSRFDRYMRGDDVEVTPSELRGFNLFMGKAGCGTCHFAPLFNGTVPPSYEKTEVEILGVPADPAAEPLRLDPDPGRYDLYQIETHRHAFKTTTVRNAALTAPYMHNGAYETLDEVVEFYNAGGGAGLGIEVPHQTLPPDSLGLNDTEIGDLVAFMEALTDVPGDGAVARSGPSDNGSPGAGES
jgi:cytochrome c peroxidase